MARRNKKQPKAAKRVRKKGLYTPEEQQARVRAGHAAGKSMRTLAEEEGRDRSTIKRILVRSEERNEHLKKVNAALDGLCTGSVDVLEAGLNGPLPLAFATALRILESRGLLPKMEKVLHEVNERAITYEQGVQGIMALMLNSSARKNKQYKLADVDIEPEPRPVREQERIELKLE